MNGWLYEQENHYNFLPTHLPNHVVGSSYAPKALKPSNNQMS